MRGVKQEKRRSRFFLALSLFSFNVPEKYLKLLDGIYVDDVVFQAPFKQFVERVTAGWQQDVINVSKSIDQRFGPIKSNNCSGSSVIQCKYCFLGHPKPSSAIWNKCCCHC